MAAVLERICAKHPSSHRHADGRCAECHNVRNREYGKTRKDQTAARMRRWIDNNREEHRVKARERMRRWRETNGGKRKMKGYLLQRNYGISIDDFEQMAVQQKGLCAICDDKLDMGFNTAVDHDHATGAVRGLLCSRCNRSLGGFRDQIDLLTKAAEYLRRHGD